MITPMNVTVVIPCYNEAPENLTEAVASVPKDPGTEVIVVNDGSTRRETLEVLDSLDVKVIHQVTPASPRLATPGSRRELDASSCLSTQTTGSARDSSSPWCAIWTIMTP